MADANSTATTHEQLAEQFPPFAALHDIFMPVMLKCHWSCIGLFDRIRLLIMI